MLKLTRTIWLILALGILVITFASLGAVHSQRLNEGKQVSDELAVAELRLSKFQLNELYAQQAGLEEKINTAVSQLTAAKTKLAQSNESITISDAVFQIAEASGVEVTEINSSSRAPKYLEQIGCLALPFSALVRGDVPNLISFITNLNDDFTTGTVTSAQITVPEVTGSATGDDRPMANVHLVIYSYQVK